jgi:RNA polymerase sigma factor (sigma-70 family)
MREMAGNRGGGTVASAEEVAELFAAQSVRLRRMVRSGSSASEALVEDACQLAWLRLLQRPGRVRREAATAWLTRTAIREAFRQMRREARDLSLDVAPEEMRARSDRPTPDVLEELIGARMQLEAVRALPTRPQRYVWMQALGFSYEEMARRTAATPRTVQRQLVRARRRLSSPAGEGDRRR